MAEMITIQKAGRRKVHSLRVDLTPMVDLGFLLISFFMLTTTMANQKTMEIDMPSPVPAAVPPTTYPEESTVSIIPVKGHRVYYYNGLLRDEAQLKNCAINDVRDVLMKQKTDVAHLPESLSAEAHKLHVIIKPNDDSKYEDLVKMLDEMTISAVPYYALEDISPEEKSMLLKK